MSSTGATPSIERRRLTVALDASFAALAAHVALGALLRSEAPVPLRMGTAALHVTLAVAFLRRRPSEGGLSFGGVAAAAPSIALGAAPLALNRDAWPTAPLAQGAFVLGALGASAALLALGRSFGILPARRGVVTRGPYGVVRHPAYLAEWIMFVALVSAAGALVAVALGALACVALIVRVHAEERALRRDAAYVAYAERVRYRFVPGIY